MEEMEQISFPDELFNFATMGSWKECINLLTQLTLPENWEFIDSSSSSGSSPVLCNYIKYTYKRLVHLSCEKPGGHALWFGISKRRICFNTGLFTQTYDPIYCVFSRHQSGKTRHEIVLSGFYPQGDNVLNHFPVLPPRATYFNDIRQLIYDTSLELRINSSHILNDVANKERIPVAFQNSSYLLTLFNGAVELAKKRIEANYKTAVPQYYNGTIQLLVPISLQSPDVVDLALAVYRKEGFYTGRTCLTLSMAYNNARLIAKPDSDWLIAPKIIAP